MSFIAIINLSTAIILALLLFLMRFNYSQIRFFALMATGITAATFLLAFTGNAAGWFSINYLNIITLEQGVFSIAFATGLGTFAGLLLNIIKKAIVKAFVNWRASSNSASPS